jgi:hypothetical protein
MADKKGSSDTPSKEKVNLLNRAKQIEQERLFKIPGVHTVGVGFRRRGGKLTDELAVVVYVDRKLPKEDLREGWLIPPEIRFHMDPKGEEIVIPTDVVERPRAVEYPHLADGSLAGRVRPVPGGRSIQGSQGGGTLGGWVWDQINDQTVLISNNHVLGSTVGANVYQPWGSTAAADQIADNVRTSSMDATIAAPTDGAHIRLEIEGVAPAVYETTQAVLNMQVEKSGATTEHTTGRVVAVNLTKAHLGSTNDFEVDPDAGQARFAYYGDSGSLIVERTHPEGESWKRVVGLLWGGDPPLGNAYGHQIEDVFADLNLTTVCDGVISEFIDSLFASSFSLVGAGGAGVEDFRHVERLERRGVTLRKLHIGLAREVDERVKLTKRGKKLSDLARKNWVALVELAVDPGSRRVLAAAAAPLLKGLWSADELLEKQITEDDLSRFQRALSKVQVSRDLKEVVKEAGSLLKEVKGRSMDDILGSPK